MSTDDIAYARSHDGLHIAYQVRGDGPITIVEIGNWGTLFPMDAWDEQPRWHRFEERLTRFARLVKHDVRGVGSSDPFTAQPTVDDYVLDVIAVMDDAGIERAALVGSSFGGHAAIVLAARFPGRVSSLVLVNTGAYFGEDVADDQEPQEAEAIALAERARELVDPTVERDTEQNDIDYLAPSLPHDADLRRWWLRTARRGAGPVVAEAVWRLSMEADERPLLPDVSVPTLVIVTTRNQFIPASIGRWMAGQIPGAELCEIDTPDQVLWATPDDRFANELERHLTGSVATWGHSRSVSAVLFTDIVESTSENSVRGDRAWLELLERHDAVADREVALHNGRVVKRLGDGLLAVFPLASDALDAAFALTAAADSLGIAIRAGLHLAEIEHVGDDEDVLGLGVTVAARALGCADGGEVVVTRTVAGALAGAPYRFVSKGVHGLKGVEGTWELLSASRS